MNPGASAIIDVLSNDLDPDGVLDPSTVTIVDQPANGTIDLVDPLTGNITYSHDGSPTTRYG